MSLTTDQFVQQRQAVRGIGNPQRMNMPLWEELIWSGENAWAVTQRFGQNFYGPPGWCFDRFGMSRTRLPDGRIICIAGEHEDYYDPDFFIYNDVIVIHPDGRLEIFGYSPEIFPPTDFHTATLVGESIYIIGRVGYQGQRGGVATPIYRLDISTLSINRLIAVGDGPSWIAKHRAQLAADGKTIRISGGKVSVFDHAGKEEFRKNHQHYALDTEAAHWSLIDGTASQMPTLPQNLNISGWAAMENDQESQDLQDSILLAVGPAHPLFCGEFMVISKWREWTQQVALQMLDGTGRWAICDGPDHAGREDPPLAVTFYSDFDQLLEAAAKLEAEDRNSKPS